MLNKEEDLRLAACLDVLRAEVNGETDPVFKSPPLNIKSQLWLAEKLKESNDQLKKVDGSIQQFMAESWNKHWETTKEEDDADALGD